jgi:hypothetical protein
MKEDYCYSYYLLSSSSAAEYFVLIQEQYKPSTGIQPIRKITDGPATSMLRGVAKSPLLNTIAIIYRL